MLPSKMDSTSRSRPITSGEDSTETYLRTELVGRTATCLSPPRRVIRASAIPRPRYSCSGADRGDLNGSTASDLTGDLCGRGSAAVSTPGPGFAADSFLVSATKQ